MDKLNILVFVDWYRPGFKGGGPVRSMINMVDHLGDQCNFYIVTGDTDYSEKQPYTGVATDQWVQLPSGEQVWYASAKSRTSKGWNGLLTQQKWDAVYINGMFSLWYSIMPLWLTRNSKTKRVVVARGMLLPGPVKQGALKKQSFLFLARSFGLYKGIEFQATSSEENESIKTQIGRQACIHTVSNFPRKLTDTELPARKKIPGEADLVNVVRIATEKNIHVIIEALRNIKGIVNFDLYGPVYHEEYWAQCLKAIATLPNNVHFNYNGPVTSELVPGILRGQHHALFMPNQGDNFGHTMVEAMTNGLPLLIADTSPWRDLRKKNAGWDIPLNCPNEFTAAVQELVDMDQTNFDRLSAGALRMGMEQVNDAKTKEAMLKIFRS